MRNREDCEYYDRAGRYCIEGPDCLCKKKATPMPNDNTHTLLPCPFCGKSDEVRVATSAYQSTGEYRRVTCDRCGVDGKQYRGKENDHLAVAAWNTRTPAEPKAEAEEPEIGCHICPNCGHRDEYEILVAEPKAGDWEQGLDQLHDALGLLKLGDHPDKVFGEYVFPLFRALSSAAPRITEEMVERVVEDRVGLIHCECPSCDGSGLNSGGRQDAEAGFTPDPDSMCEKCNGEGWIREMPYCDPDEVKDDLIALLRQQGPQRSEDQQGAERKWISVDERLPEKEGMQLCFLSNCNVLMSYQVRGIWSLPWSEERVEVLYWMPIPTPPPFTPTQTEE